MLSLSASRATVPNPVLLRLGAARFAAGFAAARRGGRVRGAPGHIGVGDRVLELTKPNPEPRVVFDQDERRCTIYAARPGVCRKYPEEGRCGYFDFLKFEREQQGDDEFIPSA